MNYQYTMDQALADLGKIKYAQTDEVVLSREICLHYLADLFALVERHNKQVQALLMSKENLEALVKQNIGPFEEGDPSVGSEARIWAADIFCPSMPHTVVYALNRDILYDESRLRWARLKLEGLPVVPPEDDVEEREEE